MKSKWLRYGLIIAGSVLALVVVFGAGIFVGRATSRPGSPPFPFVPLLLKGSHGAVGTVSQIDAQTITVELRDGLSQVILVDSQTHLEKNRQRITLTDIKIGDQLQVVGSPADQGGITAKWIRVMVKGSPARDVSK